MCVGVALGEFLSRLEAHEEMQREAERQQAIYYHSLDSKGRHLSVGDRVAWPAGMERTIREGTVKAITAAYLVVSPDGSSGVARIKRMERVVKLETRAA